MIWTLGDFNSVYLLTGGGPADLTHVLATLGIRYLRLDQVDLSMASIVVRAAAGAAAGLLHDEAAVQMKRALACARHVATEAKLLLIGIPVLLWTMHPDLPPVPVRDLAAATRRPPGKLWPEHPTLQNFAIVFQQQHFYLEPLLAAAVELAADRGRGRRADAVRRHLRPRSRSAG